MEVLAVSELALFLQAHLQAHPLLGDLWIRGEATDVRRSPAGHWYFCLREESALLRCVLFRGQAWRVAELPEQGKALVVHGGIDFYPPSGSLQLIADLIYPEGVGLQHLQLEALKLKLEAEGFFAAERKRPLPPFPRRIGVVTSDGGAVIHDILTVLGRRYPVAEVIFAPASVQGDRAPLEIVAALRALSRYRESGHGLDLVILARGGGSREDLAAFNDERVARAVFACSAPVVSAVGHETDYTIADLVADLRAPTPSAAAEMATPDVAALRSEVLRLKLQAAHHLAGRMEALRGEVGILRRYLGLRSPSGQVARRREAVRAQSARAEMLVQSRLRELRHSLDSRGLQLRTLDPSHTLARGYAICYNRSGQVISGADQLARGDLLEVQLHRGGVEATILALKGCDGKQT